MIKPMVIDMKKMKTNKFIKKNSVKNQPSSNSFTTVVVGPNQYKTEY